jgi:hypothetical protein
VVSGGGVVGEVQWVDSVCMLIVVHQLTIRSNTCVIHHIVYMYCRHNQFDLLS